MGKFLRVIGFGFGLSSGAGLVYGMYTSEAARMVVILLVGVILTLVIVLLTVAVVLRFSRQPEQRVTYNQRYDPPQLGNYPGSGQYAEMPPPGYPVQPYPQVMLPPVEYSNGKYTGNDENEIVA